jgi:ABC-2 type transport system permease protein
VLAVTRAELTKIITLRSVWFAAGGVLALDALVGAENVGANTAAIRAITPDGMIEIFTGEPQPAVAAVLDQLAGSALQMNIFLPVLVAIIAGQEFRHGQLGVSLLAVPHRARLMTAKTLAVMLFLVVTSAALVTINVAFMYPAVRGWDPGLLLSASALRGYGMSVLFTALFACVPLAITVTARSTLAGIVASVVLVVVTMTQALTSLSPRLDALLPVSAGRDLLLDPALGPLSGGRGPAGVVLICWAATTLALATLSLIVRDAR